MEQSELQCCVGCGRDTEGDLCRICAGSGCTQIRDSVDHSAIPVFAREAHIPLEDNYSEESGGEKALA